MTIPLRKTPLRILSATAAAVLAVGMLAGCADDETAPAASSSPAAEASESPTENVAEDVTEFSYAGQDGETALDLLLVHDPEAEVSGEGEMAYVTAIKGRTAAENKEYWALYVDGEMAQVGAGALETEEGQQVQWKLEKIEQ